MKHNITYCIIIIFAALNLNFRVSAQKRDSVPVVTESHIRVYAKDVIHKVSRYLTGACIEDVNHEIYGGLYSQMIFGESFQEPVITVDRTDSSGTLLLSIQGKVSRMWRPVQQGSAQGIFSIDTVNSFIGTQSQRVEFYKGNGEVGVENQSLNRWGMYFQKGKTYEGCLWIKAAQSTNVYISMENTDGKLVYAENRIVVTSGAWKRFDFSITPNKTDKKGRFAIKLKQPGSIELGYVFLQPGAWGRYQKLPVRKDIAEALIAQKLTVLRYGGSMVSNAPGGYLWKRMIGPRDLRPPYNGKWYPWSTNGWGIIDFINFCNAAGVLAIPDFNINEPSQDMADFVEYVNGPADTPWGQKRFADGHPEPYKLKYLELGNEEAINEEYWKKFQPIAEAIWSKDPDIKIVVGDLYYSEPISDPFNFSGTLYIKSLKTHQKILELAKKYNREILFDVHIDTDRPDSWRGLNGVPSFIDALGKICPGAKYKVVIFEFNAGHHDMGRALGNARAINEIERLGSHISIACSANCLQPYQQNDNGWDQGLLFLSPSQVWGQPPYYVTQMASENYLSECVKAESESPDNALDVTALRSDDGRILQIQVVNLKNKPIAALIELKNYTPVGPEVKVTVLRSDFLEECNTPEQPKTVVPEEYGWEHKISNGKTSYVFSSYSYTIMRFE